MQVTQRTEKIIDRLYEEAEYLSHLGNELFDTKAYIDHYLEELRNLISALREADK